MSLLTCWVEGEADCWKGNEQEAVPSAVLCGVPDHGVGGLAAFAFSLKPTSPSLDLEQLKWEKGEEENWNGCCSFTTNDLTA
jgi:hypothetical protein